MQSQNHTLTSYGMGTAAEALDPQKKPLTLEELLELDHLSKLAKCDTLWTLVLVGYTDGSSEALSGRNYCKHRDCDHPDCMFYRVMQEERYFKSLFNSFRRRDLSLVTLTFGGHQEITSHTLPDMKYKVKKFIRQLQYLGGGRYKAVPIYEMKREPDGLYHCHVHIAFERSPHHTQVINKWNKINGKTTRADIKYSTSKKAVARYFARRVALGGVGMPVQDYMRSMHGHQLKQTYGVRKADLDAARAATNQLPYNLVVKRNDSTKKIAWVHFCGTFSKWRGDEKPPPVEWWGIS